jgi:hypothetical protein
VYGMNPTAYLELEDPWFKKIDEGKKAVISGSALGNNGTYDILEVITSRLARVSHASPGFVTEDELTWGFDPYFLTEANVPWEVVETGVNAAAALTLREQLPAANTVIDVEYVTIPSGHSLREETANTTVAPTLWYPSYILDAAEGYRNLIRDMVAAGVIPQYYRPW